uniref:Uncharacterized protein LOC100181108 n=1 Tax=Phallusia mammillata TaxID=59560 RepID=A0A6F9DGP2_9ASCI|nr:uncharacterized protein LOC100181108 [Phallusia mammillata]
MSLLFVASVLLLCTASCCALTCPNITGVPQVPLPYLDSVKFHYKIQISVDDLNQTLDATEYYDHVNNQTFLYLDQATMRSKMSYDYNFNQVFTVDELANTCSVADYNGTQGSVSLIGMHAEKGPQFVKYPFVWNSGYNATSMGVAVIDGIQTDHYQMCLSHEDGNLTYQLDIYFSSQNWSMPAGQNAPVRIDLNATVDSTTTGSHLYTYKFYDYHDSTSKELWKPDLPGDIVCEGRKDVPVAPDPPSQMQLRMEVVMGSYLQQVYQYFDYDNKMLRVDITGDNINTPHMNTIHNFKDGLQYMYYPATGLCDIKPIPPDSMFEDTVVVNSSLVSMIVPNHFGALANATYCGVTMFLGYKGHCWKANTVALAHDFYFNGTAAWVQDTYYNSVDEFNGMITPLGMKQVYTSQQNNGTVNYNVTYNYEFDMFDYHPRILDSDVFHATECFNESQKTEIILKFPNDVYPMIKASPANFSKAVVSATLEHSKVLPTRVVPKTPYTVIQEPDQKSKTNVTYVYVGVTLLGVPNVKGDSVEMVPQPSLAQAISDVKSAVQGGEFILRFNTNAEIAADSEYFNTQDDLIRGQQPSPPPAPSGGKVGVSTGVVVGVSVAMLIVGIMVGCFIMIYRSKRASSQYAYTMQD